MVDAIKPADRSRSASQSVSSDSIIKVAIVEDLRDIREGLATLIKFTDGYRCTSSFRSMGGSAREDSI